MNTALGILFGLVGLVLLGGAALVLLPLLRARRAPTPPAAGANGGVPLSTAEERQRRLAEALQRRQAPVEDPLPDFSQTPELPPQRDTAAGVTTPQPVTVIYDPSVPLDQRGALAGEVLPPGAALPATEQRQSGPVFDNSNWMLMQEQMEARPRRSRRMVFGAILVGTVLLALLFVFVVWLVGAVQGARPPAPGTAVLTVADFGEGPQVASSAAGKRLADTLRLDLQSNLQTHPELVVRSAGRITNRAEAERALQSSHALIWGTLPAGETGSLSATLQLRSMLVGAPWEQVGPAGRLLLIPAVALADQSRVMQGNLELLLRAILFYQDGNFASARAVAEGLAGNDNPALRGMALFIRANALTAENNAAAAVELYNRLDTAGWNAPAVLNNWGVAAEELGQYDTAKAAYDRALAAAPAPSGTDQARILASRGHAALYLAHDMNAARADFQAALQAEPRQWDAARELGFMAYQDADVAGARTYTEQALKDNPNDPASVRQMGLVVLLEGHADQGLTYFQQALTTYDTWISTLLSIEGAAQSRGDTLSALQATQHVRAINQEQGTTQYYRGLALSELARNEPPPNDFERFLRSVGLRAPGHGEQALDAFNDAIRLDRDRADVRLQMGILQRRMGHRAAASVEFNKATTLDNTLPGPYENLAAMYLEDKKPADAIHEYEALNAVNPQYMPAYIQLAELYEANNQHDKAQDTYNRALTIPPQRAEDYYNLALAFHALKRDDEARAAVQEAVKRGPDNWQAHLLLGQLDQAAGQNTEALQEYAAVVRLNKTNAQAPYEAGRILAALGRLDEARQQWQDVVRRDPKHPDAYFALAELDKQTGQVNAALGDYDAAIRNGVRRDEAYTQRGRMDEAARDWPQAEKDYRAALQVNSGQLDARDGLVRALVHLYRADDAVQVAQDGRKVSASSPQPYLELAQAYLAKNDPTAASAPLEVARGLLPNDAGVLLLLGRSAVLRGDDGGAQQFLNAALVARPDYPEAAALLGDNDYNNSRFAGAIDWYTKALAMHPPDYPPAHAGLGRAAQRLGKTQDAKTEYLRAVTIDRYYAEPRLFLGDLYAELTQWNEAVNQYQLALQLRPHWAEAHFQRAQVLMQLKRTGEAIQEYNLAVRDDANYTEAWFGLGQALRDSGDRANAIKAYQQAVRLNASYAQAWLYLGYTYEENGQASEAADAYRHARDTATDDQIRRAATDALARLRQ